jgi:gamma-glutamylcyclotransferase (GGCT)/AIG2-like uncharacterized protein YtfP
MTLQRWCHSMLGNAGWSRQPSRAAIRRYASWLAFSVWHALDCQTPDYIALYGSLRKRGGIGDEPDLSKRLKPAGAAIIEGKLIDLGTYPGLILGSGNVQAELYEVVDRDAFRIMDQHERYDPTDIKGSLYLRRAVRLLQPSVDAWVYVYNHPAGAAPEVASGDWIEHLASKATSRPAGVRVARGGGEGARRPRD